ncbi:MAG: VanW family protein [Eubacterium sp.]|nr:VanW family protein [Eubacterium sp.]
MKVLKRITFLITALTLMFCISAFVMSAEKKDDKTVIKRGVQINGENVSGMKKKEATVAVKDAVKNKTNIKVKIKVGANTCETRLVDLGYEWSNVDIVDDALEYGKVGSPITRYVNNAQLRNGGKNFSIDMKLNVKKMKKKFKKAVEPYELPVLNAELKATGHGFKILKEDDGYEVDQKKSTNDFANYINKKWDGKSDINFTATTKVTKPKYTVKDCMKVSNKPMGSFTTSVSGGEINKTRNKNIKLDGYTIYPGEQFSCNDHLAPWTEDNGWYNAGTIVGSKVEDSLGGGICQVASTLYNALLRAEIKVVKRFPHSLSVGYVDFAADAALAGDYKDLVFENNTDAPIYLQSHFDGVSLTFNIYGHDTRKKWHRVEYVSELIKTIPVKKEVVKDPTKPVGFVEVEEGHVGRVAKLWKITYEHGKQVSKELLHESKYKMVPTKTIKGTGKNVKETTAEGKKKNEATSAEH